MKTLSYIKHTKHTITPYNALSPPWQSNIYKRKSVTNSIHYIHQYTTLYTSLCNATYSLTYIHLYIHIHNTTLYHYHNNTTHITIYISLYYLYTAILYTSLCESYHMTAIQKGNTLNTNALPYIIIIFIF